MPKSRFKRLGLFYLIALGLIALSIVISQLLIQTSINRQQEDAHVVNVAGRQRMLSQKISKAALMIRMDGINDKAKNELEAALDLWHKSHQGLQYGDSTMNLSGENPDIIVTMYEKIQPHFEAIYTHGLKLSELDNSRSRDTMSINYHVSQIMSNEEAFLQGMDEIVFLYDEHAREKITSLKQTEFVLFVISILIIALELAFVFRPLAKNVRRTVTELTEQEKGSRKMAAELSKLYEELGRSYQDLEAVNIQPNPPVILSTFHRNGKFLNNRDKLIRLLEYDEKSPPVNFEELLIESGYKKDFVEGLMTLLREGKNWTGELRLVTEPGDFCWIETHLVPVTKSGEIKFIGCDITEFKEARIRSREINKERIEKSVREQHYRSALILQGQEEERKRLSREIHDGVGQMLSAMKLQLESLTVSSGPMQIRLKDARALMKSIIKEVRRVSFNLTPSSLDDFGLVPAVKKFCTEIDAVSETKIEFVNETRFITRLENHIETNLYRIIQEAVNNAIKYSRAENIRVRFLHTVNSLSISVEDNGRGFDYGKMEEDGQFEEAGHGIFNMKERTAYIGGKFDISSSIGGGTKIFITLSLDKND